MLKRISLIFAAVALMLATGYANQSTGKLVIPVDRTNPTDSKAMYSGYCAPCHGVDGRGRGPAASALKTQPVDLTTLTRMNRGKYPDTHVLAVLRFGSTVPAHGSAGMPVWGPILDRMDTVRVMDRDLRISNLNRYLETMQAK